MLDLVTKLLLVVIVFLPKINIITIPGMTTGIRCEDFLVAIWIFLVLASKSKFINSEEIKKVSGIYSMYIIVCILSNIINSILGNINFLLSLVFLFRKIEYFIFIYIRLCIYA